ncbi:exo-beta-glucanase [Colletotrichum tabaci]|uniref:Exo-beta-glucanase n=1 Tax=Colletotrichum tabaci TaxID=1209068 RepID=A0AAV9T010_9PEZI
MSQPAHTPKPTPLPTSTPAAPDPTSAVGNGDFVDVPVRAAVIGEPEIKGNDSGARDQSCNIYVYIFRKSKPHGCHGVHHPPQEQTATASTTALQILVGDANVDAVFDENEVSIAWLAVLTVERLKPIQEDSVVFATEPKYALVVETQTPENHMFDPRMQSTPSWGATLNELQFRRHSG